MPKWISIDEAAHKYGVKEEDICLWAEMEAITAYFTETTLIIDEKEPSEILVLARNPSPPKTTFIRWNNSAITNPKYAKFILKSLSYKSKTFNAKSVEFQCWKSSMRWQPNRTS